MISYQGYFLNFKDILIPLYYACDLINKGCYDMVRNDHKEDSLILYSTTTIDDKMMLHSNVTQIVDVLKTASESENLQMDDITNLFGTLFDVLKYQTVNSKEDLVTSVMKFALEVLSRGLKTEGGA